MFLKSFIFTLISLVVLDLLWLRLIAKKFYQNHIGYLYAEKAKWWSIFAFYLMYPIAITFLAVIPATLYPDYLSAFVSGSLIGLASYGAFNFTNQAIIKNWPIKVTFVDLIWGTIMTALSAQIAYSLIN